MKRITFLVLAWSMALSATAGEAREFLVVQAFQNGRLLVTSRTTAVLTLEAEMMPLVYSTDEYVGTSTVDGFVHLWPEEQIKPVEAVLEVADSQLGSEIPVVLKAASMQGAMVAYKVEFLEEYPSWHEQARASWVTSSPLVPNREIAFGAGVLLLRFRSPELTSLIFRN